MTDNSHYERQAQESAESAVRAYASGNLASAIDLMREAAVLFAAADSAIVEESQARILSRAVACRHCGDYLAEGEQYAEAATIYQESVDQYSRLTSEEAEVDARRTARKLLDCIAMLKARPYDRLNLLIAQYEHRQHQYAAQRGHERQQAECAEHIAKILARRERYEQAVERYREALELFKTAGNEPDVNLAIAECHHRIAGLFAYRLSDTAQALQHYRYAIALYSQFEPEVYGDQQSRSICEQAVNDLE